MCTAIGLCGKEHYFGRNLDLDRSYGEEVCVMPRHYPMEFRRMGRLDVHYAIIGMATVVGGVPLFYDAANEHGLGMAGLNFPYSAYYPPLCEGKENVTPFEFIPWILGQCKTVDDAEELLSRINLVNIPFSDRLPLSPLHWMLSDRKRSIVVESMRDGLHIHPDPVHVLTNEPPFPHQLFHLNNYRGLGVTNGENTFSNDLDLQDYCQGLGGIGLPGDVSSMSRFVRAAFCVAHSVCDGSEEASVGQFFHLLDSVAMLRGICKTPEGTWDITRYSACIDLDRGLYYYTTYEDRQIHCVDLHRTALEGSTLSRFSLADRQVIRYQN